MISLCFCRARVRVQSCGRYDGYLDSVGDGPRGIPNPVQVRTEYLNKAPRGRVFQTTGQLGMQGRMHLDSALAIRG